MNNLELSNIGGLDESICNAIGMNNNLEYSNLINENLLDGLTENTSLLSANGEEEYSYVTITPEQAQQAAQLGFAQQGQLATLQPTLAGQQISQLGGIGTQNLAYQQAILDAQRQAAQFAYQEPYTRLQTLGSGIGGLLAGYPQPGFSQTSATQQQVSPLSQALSAAAGAYGLGTLFGK